ncbi:pentapeptide repeat-containing protein [Bradyrhizobium sp. URHD0069]|uniref:pentapeptide repeat-containing protein n=1 Tax=Bradyrhizobium sp. URHD0069 TaxID=1380355 RepID=UPI0009DF26AE|nr:pentapeptide repeat-containing protein [Bradyrhizobium sp. URHD0069]
MANSDDMNLLETGATDLSGCDFASADLSKRQLAGRDFSGANLSNANAEGADFSGCISSGASLHGMSADQFFRGHFDWVHVDQHHFF